MQKLDTQRACLKQLLLSNGSTAGKGFFEAFDLELLRQCQVQLFAGESLLNPYLMTEP